VLGVRVTPSTLYRPWLDGVRGVAVFLVVAEHVGDVKGLSLPRGMGEAGVGIFFGLSGYLITGLLLEEYGRYGRVRLRDFYIRRAARLFPALLLMLVLCNILFVALGRRGVLRESVAALLYLANYATVAIGEYLTGYGQTWSLAIEEHFYLVWPIVLLWLLGRRRGLRALLRWTLLAAAAALAWRTVLLFGTDAPTLLLYHGSVERADALLYGCAAAVAVRMGWRPRAWLGWFAVAALALVVVVSDNGPAGITLVQAVTGVASAALMVTLDHVPGRLRRLLTLLPVVWVGLVSYGIYLWHWPLLIMSSTLGYDQLVVRMFVGFVLTPTVAAASYYFLERPVRARVRRRLAHTGAPSSSAGKTLGR
jgi:peptidoglycan/LPS O-acetylase OafA/YrhL